MPSLREISSLSPVVVLDAASSLVQVGRLHRDGSSAWECSSEESGVAIFQCFSRLGVPPAKVGCWVFCEGPGSVLGIRTAAMALRTWGVLHPAPTYAYQSLAVVAHARGNSEVGYIADARRDHWHHYKTSETLRRLPTQTLTGTLMMPENFRHWTPLPPGVSTVPYLLRELLPRVWDADLLRASSSPDAFLHEEPHYVSWNPQIHRAPTTASEPT